MMEIRGIASGGATCAPRGNNSVSKREENFGLRPLRGRRLLTVAGENRGFCG
jgi:hypothetical protein